MCEWLLPRYPGWIHTMGPELHGKANCLQVKFSSRLRLMWSLIAEACIGPRLRRPHVWRQAYQMMDPSPGLSTVVPEGLKPGQLSTSKPARARCETRPLLELEIISSNVAFWSLDSPMSQPQMKKAQWRMCVRWSIFICCFSVSPD